MQPFRPKMITALFAVLTMIIGVLAVAPTASAQEPPPPGQLVVANAYENTRFSIYVDGTLEIDTKELRFLGAEDLTPGQHTVDVFAEGQGPSGTPIISRTVNITSETETSFIVHPNAAGDLSTTVFDNGTERTGAGESRLIVRHAAQAGPVDIELRPSPTSGMASEATRDTFTLSNGQQAVVEGVNAADNLIYELVVRPAGSTDTLIVDTEVEFVPGEPLVIVIAGDPPRAESAQDPEFLLRRETVVGALPAPAIYLVNGFSTGQYDFYIDGEVSRTGIEAKRRSGLLQPTNSMGENISDGTYTVEVYPVEMGPDQGGNPTPIASLDIGVCDGRSYSLAVHPDAAGNETLTLFENDVRAVAPMSTRITVRHIGEAGEVNVDIAKNGENSAQGSTANFNLANGDEEVLDEFLVNDYNINAFRAGTTQLVAQNGDSEGEGEAALVAYILGSPPQPNPPGDSLITYGVPTIAGAPAPGTECASDTTTGGGGDGTGGNGSDGATTKFVPVDPQRAIDTRTSGGPIADGESITIDATSVEGVPADAVAVAVNLTAVNTQGRGFLSASADAPSGAPGSSSVNFTGPSQIRAATNTVPLASDGTFNVYVAGGANVLADITGYYIASDATTDGRFVPIQPRRAFDTRDSSGPGPAIAADTPFTFDIDSTTPVPESGVTAVVLNVTTARMTDGGFLEVRPGGQAVTGTSSVNFTPGVPVANHVIVPVGPGNEVTFEPSTATDVLVDVYGYYTDSSAESSTTGLFVPVDPTRAVDTRNSESPSGRVGPDGSITVPVASTLGISASDVIAVDATLTAVRPLERTFLTAYPSGSERPNASVVNADPGGIRANSVYVATASATFDVYSFESSHVLADLSGYFTS